MHMMNQYATPLASGPIVVKYGGNAIPAHDGSGTGVDPVLAEIAGLRARGQAIVLIHGGGPQIDRALAERNIATVRIEGMRVTDAPTLQTTEAVLCGSVNKRLVRECVALGMRAVGISGQDGGTLVASQLHAPNGADLGYVGNVVSCDSGLVRMLLAGEYLPVIAPLAIATDASHAFNVNADLAAAAIAGALQASAFVLVTNVARVLRDPADPASGIAHLNVDEAQAFLQSDACREGMKPKIAAAIAALQKGASATYICASSGLTTLHNAIAHRSATIIT